MHNTCFWIYICIVKQSFIHQINQKMSTLVTLILSLVMDLFSAAEIQSAQEQQEEVSSFCIEMTESTEANLLSENEKNSNTPIVG